MIWKISPDPSFTKRGGIYRKSGRTTIIRPNTNECQPEYLTVYLNAVSGQMQADKHSRASGQPYTYPLDMAQFLVYLPSEEFQQRIVALVQQSYNAHQSAKKFLVEAKAKVETLIEKEGKD